MKLYLQKDINSLKPSDEQSEEYFKKLKIGTIVSCDIKKPRNVKFHRKFFALLKLVLNNQERYTNTDQLLIAIKLKLGMYTICKSLTDKPFPILKSISFARMDDLEFAKLYDDTLFILAEFIQVDPKKLDQEVMNFM